MSRLLLLDGCFRVVIIFSKLGGSCHLGIGLRASPALELLEFDIVNLTLDFFKIKVKPVRVENDYRIEILAIPIKKQYQREFRAILRMAQKMCDQNNSQNLSSIDNKNIMTS